LDATRREGLNHEGLMCRCHAQNDEREMIIGCQRHSGTNMRRALTTQELRRTKATRDEFPLRPRRPISVVLDGVTQNYNIGAIFRLCDAFLVQELVICGIRSSRRRMRLP
jgi:tRNA G18 (ribose-2'-O)-methylase SpoU